MERNQDRTNTSDLLRNSAHSQRTTADPWLGAAFATKFLYFASAANPAPQNLILDAVVANNLRASAWTNSPTYGWWSQTYADYCKLLARWAAETDKAPDQVEMMLFKL